jgi:signal transduction histidine kinase
MSDLFAGIVGAWSVSHAAIGLYFLLAFALGRREREFMLFGLLCFAFSIASLGIALDFISANSRDRLHFDVLAHVGFIIAGALNLHFALEFARVPGRARLLPAIYALALVFEVANVTGWLWREHRAVETTVFGRAVHYGVGEPTTLGYVFYAFGAVETLTSIAILAVAYRSGRPEALSALIGAALVLPALANDLGIALGLLDRTITLLPHAFLVYAFGVAAALLVRFKIASGEIEHATTSLKQRTEELLHSHAELRQVQGELSSKKQLAVVGELAAAIAHEVRNPLAIIVNAVAGLRRGSLKAEERTTLLDIVDEEAARLNRLVGDLLRFARPFSINRLPVSLGELARRFKGSFEGSQEIVTEIDAVPEADTVWVDPNLFRLVFDNLLSNARQATRDRGVILVRIRPDRARPEPSVRIEVVDTGEGMDPEVQRRALDPFFTTRPSGTGLGLPIVQRIVEAHGGDLRVHSAGGAGTTVTVTIPVARPPGVQADVSGVGS